VSGACRADFGEDGDEGGQGQPQGWRGSLS